MLERVRRVPARQPTVALSPEMGGVVTEVKTPLDERALDRLMLGTDAAVVAYQDQRLKVQASQKARNHRQSGVSAHMQTGGDDEIV